MLLQPEANMLLLSCMQELRLFSTTAECARVRLRLCLPLANVVQPQDTWLAGQTEHVCCHS